MRVVIDINILVSPAQATNPDFDCLLKPGITTESNALAIFALVTSRV